jgi:F0F1-type ATP synthase assembly protein I
LKAFWPTSSDATKYALKRLENPGRGLYNAAAILGTVQAKCSQLRSTGFNVIAIDLGLARRLALSVVLGQAAVTIVCSLVSWLIAGPHAALSAAMGGGISTAASLVMALLGFGGKSAADGQRAMRAFFIGESAKVVVVIALFVMVLKTMKVVPLAMLGTYVATFFVFWVALANALPPLGGKNVPRGR